MKTNLFATGLVAVTLAMSGAGAAHALDLTSSAQGWVNNGLNGNGAANGNNTFTGNEYSQRYNSWAAFDVPVGVYGSLELILTPDFYGNSVGDQIGVYDVTTAYSVFQNSSKPDNSAYFDLGTGSNYANFFAFDGSTLTITLGGTALADLNNAAGGKFIIGFTNLTKNATPSGASQDDGVYTNGGGSPVLRVTEGGVAPVPEPGAWALMILGVGGVGAALRRGAVRTAEPIAAG